MLEMVAETYFNEKTMEKQKNSKTEQPNLSNLVQMDEETSKNAKIIKETLSLSRYL